ncbi:MAG: hypothetical protein CSB33_02475 [Desulfobacterales bacterium]|nr:MAG: hypothetical protein CSB33_02475 [Desulfobacterales bacterium]
MEMARQDLRRLGKFLAYVLGRRPDEFGLLPDESGWVAVRDLLKALSEEEGWRHIRQAGLAELTVTLPDPPVELADRRIRAVDRDRLPAILPAENPPPLLYSCVRERGHAAAAKNGLSPLGSLPFVLLATKTEMALRIGRRHDREPVTVTVRSRALMDQGVLLRQFGEELYLVEWAPPDACDLPPLPKRKEAASPARKKGRIPPPAAPVAEGSPGSFFLRLEDPEEKERIRRERKEKATDRDRERKRQRQKKRRDRGFS